MMKGITLALLFSLVGSEKYTMEPGFNPSKTYVYAYQGVILSGLPERGLARSGLRLTSKLEINEASQKLYFLKIQSPRLEEYTGIWPKDSFVSSPELTQTIASGLRQIFKFEYNNGRIGTIYAPKDTPATVVNIVRGILNMFHITIKKSHNIYYLQEAGIGGICYTNYIIHEDKRNNQVSIMKSRDLNNCLDKAAKKTGMAYLHVSPQFDKKAGIVKGTETYAYKMKYTGLGALITEVTVHQVYQVSPFNEENGVGVTETKQDLSLIEVKNERLSSPGVRMQNQGSLQYRFLTTRHQMPFQLVKMNNPRRQVTEVLQHLIQNNQGRFHEDAPAKFLEFIQLIRAMDVGSLVSIWKQWEDKTQYRHWLLSAIAMAGTKDSLKFIKQKIESDAFSFLENLLAVVFSFQLTTADTRVLPIAAEIVTSLRIQKHTLLQKVALLAYGSMVHRSYLSTSSSPAEALQVLHNYANEAIKSGQEEAMVTALKALGNSGQAASIKRIQKYLPGFSPSASDLPVRVQVEAVMALRKIVRKDASKVQEIFLQIIADRSLSPKVRMMASALLFEGQPPPSVMTTVANIMLKEKGLQVASFIYSYMKTISTNYFPDWANTSAMSNIAIKLLSPKLDHLTYRYSKAIHVSRFFREYDAGAFMRFFILNSPETLFPTSIISRLGAHFAGGAIHLVEVGIQAEGLTEIVKETSASFMEYSTHRKIKELVKTLLGWKELPAVKPLLSADLKLFDQELAFFDVDKGFIQDILKELAQPTDGYSMLKKIPQLLSGISGQWTQALGLAELWYTIPTSMGLPLEYSFCATALAHLSANVDAKVTRPLSDDSVTPQSSSPIVQMLADIKPCVYWYSVAAMSINTPVFQSGIELQTKLQATYPVKLDMKLDLKEKNFTYETFPWRPETELLMASAEAFATSRKSWESETEKKIPLVPEEAESEISMGKFGSAETTFQQGRTSEAIPPNYSDSSEPELHHDESGKAHFQDAWLSLPYLGLHSYFSMKSLSAASFQGSILHHIVGTHEAWIVAKPDATIEKIGLDIEAGPKAASRLTQMMMSLENNHPLTVTGIFRVERSDHKPDSFQFAVFTNKHSSKAGVQLWVANFTNSSQWKACVDVTLETFYLAKASLKWGENCQEYQVLGEIVTGQFANRSTVQMKVSWSEVSAEVTEIGKWFYTFIPGLLSRLGFSERAWKNPLQKASLTMALTTPRSGDVTIRLPHVTFYGHDIVFPVPHRTSLLAPAPKLPIQVGHFFAQVTNSIMETFQADCSVNREKISTFNGIQYSYPLLADCFHILTQDASSELRFLVLIKTAEGSADQKAINVKLANHDIDMYPAQGHLWLQVDSKDTPLNGSIILSGNESLVSIRNESEGFSLSAPEYGIEKLYYDGKTCKVHIPFWMIGKTRGLCGQANAETIQEFQMPSGYIAKDAVSFARSWVLTDGPCSRACSFQHQFVRLEKTIYLQGENSSCSSVQPVLRCPKGCRAAQTITTLVGFHCLPTDSDAYFAVAPSRLELKSEDAEEKIEVPTRCSCDERICPA
ncbi:vitellogenin-2-like isoform X2 [Trichosurus vulpecula]|uniref:vitellogenin-2-like isoform X2 n=1 Tax=Trichosurus vulpecula TaxID=9337 RepID=UPI00186B4D01|nr:vitellogenin-2-like isoform X2 [Trichosurus vulpecula]